MSRPGSMWPARGRIAIVLAGLLMATTAMPASLGWMKGGAASFFTDRDWDLVTETLNAVLDTAADGDGREWSNEKSGADGKIIALATETRGDVTCRRVRVESRAKGASSGDSYVFCRRGDGPWGIGQPK